MVTRPVVDCQAKTAQHAQDNQYFRNVQRAHQILLFLDYSPPASEKEHIQIKISGSETPPDPAALRTALRTTQVVMAR